MWSSLSRWSSGGRRGIAITSAVLGVASWGCGEDGNVNFSLAERSSAAPVLAAPLISIPPAIDGFVTEPEWAASAAYELTLVNARGDEIDITCRVMSDDTNLYVALETPTPNDPDSYATLIIDGDADMLPRGSDAEPYRDMSISEPSPSGRFGHREFRAYTGETTSALLPLPAGFDRASSGSANVSYEFQIPISSLDTPDRDLAIKIAVYQGGLPANETEFFYPNQVSHTQLIWQNAEQWPLTKLAVPKTFIALPTTAPPTIDGVVTSAEWDGANSYEIVHVNDRRDGLSAIWSFMHDEEYLYIAAETPTLATSFQDGWDTAAFVAIDGNDDMTPTGNPNEPHQDFHIAQGAPIAWPEHTSYVVYTEGEVPDHRSPAIGTLRASSGSTNVSYEFRIPRSNLNSPENRIAVRLGLYQGGLAQDEYVHINPPPLVHSQLAWSNAEEWPVLILSDAP